MLELLLGTLMLAAIGLALREHDSRPDLDDGLLDPESYRHNDVSVYEPILRLEDEPSGRSGRLPMVLYGPRASYRLHEPAWEPERTEPVSHLLN